MIYVNEDVDYKSNIRTVHVVSSEELILEVGDPDFELWDSYGVSFQPTIKSFSKKTEYTHDAVVVFPLIPQYFHNFFEIFYKLIRLKNLNLNFSVIILFDREEFTGSEFTALQRNNNTGINAAHVKDFLLYSDIPFTCVLDTNVNQIKARSTYLFFDDGVYRDNDPIYEFHDKKYSLAHFLKVPATHLIENNISIIRDFFPKADIVKGKKVYASRKKTWDRKYDGEDDLEAVVKNLGYEIVYFEDMPLINQILTMQETEVFCCLYGSGLVNTCFMNDGSRYVAIKTVEGYYVHTYDVIRRAGVLTSHIAAYPGGDNMSRYLEANIGFFTEHDNEELTRRS